MTSLPNSLSLGFGLAYDEVSLSFADEDYHVASNLFNLAIEPGVTWHRRYFSSYPSISPFLTLGLKGHFTLFSTGETDLVYSDDGVSGTVDNLEMGHLEVLAGGPVAEWGVDWQIPKLNMGNLGGFFYGAFLVGKAQVKMGSDNSENLNEMMISSIDSSKGDILSEKDKTKLEQDISKMTDQLNQEGEYPFFAPEVGVGILWRKDQTEVQFIGLFRLYPDTLLDTFYLDSRGARLLVNRQF